MVLTRALLLIALAALLVVSTRAQQPPGNTPRFTGKTEAMESKDLSVARRRFEPGRGRRGTATTAASC
jgi:hypothetical protein